MGNKRGRRGEQGRRNPTGQAPQYRDWKWWPEAEPPGKSRSLKEFEELPKHAQGLLLERMTRHLLGQTRRADLDHLGDGIYEIRARYTNNHYRVLFIHWAQYCVALTCFYKNQQATPRRYLDRAKQRQADWLRTHGPAS